MSVATLQHFFIQMRRRPAEEAVQHVSDIVEEMRDRTGATSMDDEVGSFYGWWCALVNRFPAPIGACADIVKAPSMGA